MLNNNNMTSLSRSLSLSLSLSLFLSLSPSLCLSSSLGGSEMGKLKRVRRKANGKLTEKAYMYVRCMRVRTDMLVQFTAAGRSSDMFYPPCPMP